MFGSPARMFPQAPLWLSMGRVALRRNKLESADK